MKFIADDIIMVFFFGLASKEITEAMLPGGSLNPPRKAANPLLATVGGVIGPILIYFVLLNALHAADCFPAGFTYDMLSQGWGVVTATDIPLAWVTARCVFGSGHPAIDYLLLLAVADDAIGLVIIAIFYPDPEHPAEPVWLLLVLVGVFHAFLLRRWHFRMRRVTHQSWVPYVAISGTLAWIGLAKAHLHTALALVPIVPFMPGPSFSQLHTLNDTIESELGRSVEREISFAAENDDETASETRSPIRVPTDCSSSSVNTALSQQYRYASGRGHEISSGLSAGIVGHRVASSLRVLAYDDDGVAHSRASTLDAFEHTMKIYVDFGMFWFALCNAGVVFHGLGGMTLLVFLGLAIGKFLGICSFAFFGKCIGFPTPLGVGRRHICMVGLIGGIGLTVALFVSDAAFVSKKLTDDAKLGAILSGALGCVAYGIGKVCNFSRSGDVLDTAVEQVREAIGEADGYIPTRQDAADSDSTSPDAL